MKVLDKIYNDLLIQCKEDFPNVNIQYFFSGYIDKIENDKCFVILLDLYQETEISLEIETNKFPSGIITVGTIFYWYLGMTQDNNYFSEIRLSEAFWTKEMIKDVKNEAEKLYQLLNK